MKLLDIYPGDGKPTQRDIDIFNRVLDRVDVDDIRLPHMIEVGCYNAFWSLTFMERFTKGWVILNDIDEDHLDVGIMNFELNGHQDAYDYQAVHCSANAMALQIGFVTVDILHMDIQGAEVEFLQKADLSNVKNIVVATHSDKIHRQCKDLLKRFDIWVDLPFGTIGGDGFLVGSL